MIKATILETITEVIPAKVINGEHTMLKFKKAIRINLKSKHKIMVFGIIEKSWNTNQRSFVDIAYSHVRWCSTNFKKIAIKNKTIPKNVKFILIASSDVIQAITSNEVDPNRKINKWERKN